MSGKGKQTENSPKWVEGDQLSLRFPATLEALRAAGAEFLTAAFHAAGSLPKNNQVTDIVDFEEFFGGGAGRKAKLTVRYLREDSGLHRNLFVKMPRDFGDPLRGLFAHLMEPEVRFALLSRSETFPIAVPKCYFADYDAESCTGLLITECIAYGKGNIEPFYDKCLDYRIPDPLPHYQALVEVLATLAGSHKSGKLGDNIDTQFPFDKDVIRDADLIPYTPAELQDKLATLCGFIGEYPQLFPEHVRDRKFLTAFCAQAIDVAPLDRRIKLYLNRQTDLVSICHWNANVDNAWFERSAEGGLRAGLLDWGGVSQMNIAQGLFGITCAAEVDFLNHHRAKLVEMFATRYCAHGGPAIPTQAMFDCYRLSVAVLGLAWMIDAPSIIQAELGSLSNIGDRFDPVIHDNFLARAQLHLLTVFLNEWREEDLGRFCLEFGL